MTHPDTAIATATTPDVPSHAWRALSGLLFAGAGLLAASGVSAATHPMGLRAVAHPEGGVQFFTDPATFHAALGVPAHVLLETFDNGLPVGPFPTTCPGPFSSTTNNACFTPGQIIAGFALTASSGGDMVDVPPSFFGPGQATRVVGASTFADATVATFTPAANAAAATIYGGIGTDTYTVDISVFDPSGTLLGMTTITTGDARDSSQFLGVTSTTPIGRIEYADQNAGGELIDNVQFRAAGLAPPGLALAFSPDSVAAGTTSTLTITLGNQAQPATATLGAPLVDTLPAGLVLTTTPNATTDCIAGTVGATAGSSTITLSAGAQISAGMTCTIHVDVVAVDPGLYANTIAAGALQTDLGNSQDSVSATLTVSSGQTGTFPPSEDFDGVFAPALPDGWTTSTTTGSNDWTTQTITVDSAPNAAFAPDVGAVADLTLDSPAFTPVDGQTVSFRHRYNLERDFDGGVLEISIDGGEFSDIVSAGGHFITGGYAGVIINAQTGNPIGGRPAWTGDSAGFVTTIAALPASAVGHAVRLRFRDTADAGNLNTGEVRGWWLDSILLGVATHAPSASTDPTSLAFDVAIGGASTLPLRVANASGSDPLTFSIESRVASGRPQLVPYATFAKSSAKKTRASDAKPLVARPLASLSSRGDGRSHPARSLPWMPAGSLSFTLDDGSAEGSLGTGAGGFNPPVPFTEQAAVWINRFHASDALTIHSISVFWPEPSMAGGDLLGLQANLVVYYDADGDGDPTNAVRVGADNFVTVSETGNFVSYPTLFDVPAAGDVYVGFVDQWALAGGFTPRLYPAAIDETSPQGMSYYSSVDTPPVDIVNLANNTFTDFFTDANLMIRATVTGGASGAPCSGPNATWLSVAPAGTTVNGGESAIVAVTADSSGLAKGRYYADVCISTNDPSNLLMAVPVTLVVGNPSPLPCTAGDDIFCDGFDHSVQTGNIVHGAANQPVDDSVDGSALNFVTGSYHPYSGSLTSDDVNLYDGGDGLYGYWYGDNVPAPFQAGDVADDTGTTRVLQSGDTIGPDSLVSGSGMMSNWLAGVDGYVGVVFYNETTSQLNYGYLHVVTASPAGFPAQVLEWAYDNSGAAITIP